MYSSGKLFGQLQAPAVLPIVTDGLSVLLDSGNITSYPGNGNTWHDISGNGHDVTLNGVGFSSSNGGIMLFGINRYAIGSISMSMAPCTISTWVKYNNVGGLQFLNNLGSGGKYQLGTYNGYIHDDYGATGNMLLASNVWYMITFTIASDGTGKFYLNSTLDKTGVVSLAGTSDKYVIGGYVASPSIYSTDGNIAIAMIYNKVLSLEEIAQNFNARKDRFGL